MTTMYKKYHTSKKTTVRKAEKGVSLMKKRIIIKKSIDSRNRTILCFYLCGDFGSIYLFAQRFSKGVYEFFRRGRAEAELFKFKRWGDNPRLNKTIEKLPLYIHSAMQELIAA